MQVGSGEIILLVLVLVIVFSASRMGALGNAVGKFVYSFRKAARGEGFVDGKVERRLTKVQEPEDAEIVEGPKKPG